MLAPVLSSRMAWAIPRQRVLLLLERGRGRSAFSALTSTTSSALSSPQLPFVQSQLQSNGSVFYQLDFFWLDMTEDAKKNRVLIHGRYADPVSGGFLSGCVIIEDCFRTLLVTNSSVAQEGGETSKELIQRELLDALPASAKRLKAIVELQQASPLPGSLYEPPKLVQKKYAFELRDVPRQSTDYVQMPYPASCEAPKSGTSFRHVFGSKQSLIEGMIIQKDLAGPSWLRISSLQRPTSTPANACYVPSASLSFVNTSIEPVANPPPPPPIRLLALGISIDLLPQAGSLTVNRRQVTSVSGLLHRSFPMGNEIPKAEDVTLGFSYAVKTVQVPNEKVLLQNVVDAVARIDPDVILGHGVEDSSGLNFVLQRMKELNVDKMERLGRVPFALGRSSSMSNLKHTPGGVTPGRIIADTFKVAKEHLPPQRDYALDPLCEQFHLVSTLAGNESVRRAEMALRLAISLEAISLSFRLTTIGGNLWRRTLAGGRAERIEYLLLHAFYRAGYVLPDKGTLSTEKDMKSYEGGLVLSPKKGLYSNMILVLDFASLYPSIIMEKNICFTTVQRPFELETPPASSPSSLSRIDSDQAKDEDNDDNDNDDDVSDNAPESGAGDDASAKFDKVPDPPPPRLPGEPRAILPSVIEGLVLARKQVRKGMANCEDAALRKQMDVHQKALKITANSMYGCLGFPNSRFFAKTLAAIVTFQGRHFLQEARDSATALGYDVIYGDTDSVMVDSRITPSAEITLDDLKRGREIAQQIENAVNHYQDIKIATDAVLCPLLLLQKKKYGAVAIDEKNGKVVTKIHIRGLDSVRRDWCLASRSLGETVLSILLSRLPMEETTEKVYDAVKNFGDGAANEPLDRWVVGKAMSKPIRDYVSIKGRPHLVVALAMAEKGMHVNPGDQIPYVICTVTRQEYFKTAASSHHHAEGVPGQEQEAEASPSFADRAFSPDEFTKAQGGLQVDVNWYITKQVLPPIVRLTEPIRWAVKLDTLHMALGLEKPKEKRTVLKKKKPDA